MAAYIRFLASDPRFLAFGFLLAFASSFGQTYYIAMYSGEIRTAFDLTHGGFGTVYSIATGASGMLLVWVGRTLDSADLKIYAAVICSGLALACLAMASAPHVVLLCLAIFLLRFFGQGLMSHAATTSMARYFEARMRGRAVSFAALGFPCGEAAFPPMAVLLIALADWRQAWLAGAAMIVVIAVPGILWLLRGHSGRHQALLARSGGTGDAIPVRQWARREVLRDPRFALALSAMLAPAFVITGLMFHQVHLVEVKGWSLGWYAATFSFYAAFQIGGSVATGILVDRWSAIRLTPVYLLPAAAGLAVLSFSDHPAAAVIFMCLGGASGGAGQTLISTVWAELYGVLHLGAIRAMVSGLMVISSALSPAAMGLMIDGGVSIEAIALVCGLYYVFGSGVLALNFRGARGRATPA
jgi:MFS family permease